MVSPIRKYVDGDWKVLKGSLKMAKSNRLLSMMVVGEMMAKKIPLANSAEGGGVGRPIPGWPVVAMLVPFSTKLVLLRAAMS